MVFYSLPLEPGSISVGDRWMTISSSASPGLNAYRALYCASATPYSYGHVMKTRAFTNKSQGPNMACDVSRSRFPSGETSISSPRSQLLL
ncbi:hypothetical protein LMH87_001864 [Akanthomyces muscarius]|uniref:Uncharacterized protein n=1 Tax=Akanthomyces muscarius TaxID=2231603 RepID=A0A9W8Q7D1_AKAMU|nr:hypothetical protein LMH87_001864 [Akanthomyces muscarius]KAJ4147333.1 hypothetical protein LMH87_001864 [Akanthomyces muscarius]